MAKRPKPNGERTTLVAGFVTPAVQAIIKQIALAEDRTVSYTVRQLLEESPRIKGELRRLKTA